MAAINTQGLTKEDVIENFFYLNMGAYGAEALASSSPGAAGARFAIFFCKF